MPRTYKALTVNAFALPLFGYSFNQAIIAVGKFTHGHLSTIAQALIIRTISKEHHVVLGRKKKPSKLKICFPDEVFLLLRYIISLRKSCVGIQVPRNLRAASHESFESPFSNTS